MGNTYNNLGTVDLWKKKKSILESGVRLDSVNHVGNDNIHELNKKYGNSLNNSLKKIEDSLVSLRQAKEKYNSLISAVDNTINLVEKAEQNGNVKASDNFNTHISSATANSSLSSNFMNDIGREDAMVISDVPSSSLSSNIIDSQSISQAGMVNSISRENIASSIIDANTSSQFTTSDVKDFSVSSNLFEDLSMTDGTWERFSNIEQFGVISKLQEVGYSFEEIKQVINGSVGVSKVEVLFLKESLENVLKTNPELRSELVNLYGFDIFNEDGSIDNEKLIIALIIDQKNDDDNYNLIEYLHSNYGIDIIDYEQYKYVMSKVEIILDNYPNIQEDIIKQYGFDIFYEDKSINKNNLILALLIDKVKDDDEYNLINYLSKYKILDDSVRGVKTLSGVNLLGVTSRGSAFLFNKYKERNNF